jgi:hypothetical protein
VKATIIIIGLLLIVSGLWLSFGEKKIEPVEVTNFEECVKAGNPIMESYPQQCSHNGQTFVEHIGNELEKIDLIRLSSPRPNDTIKSPLKIVGEARGNWFFEASFPIALTDWDGRIIAQSFIMTSDEWMTTDFVKFEGELIFDFDKANFYSNRGTLILQKDNPSGLPEYDDALEIPVFFE